MAAHTILVDLGQALSGRIDQAIKAAGGGGGVLAADPKTALGDPAAAVSLWLWRVESGSAHSGGGSLLGGDSGSSSSFPRGVEAGFLVTPASGDLAKDLSVLGAIMEFAASGERLPLPQDGLALEIGPGVLQPADQIQLWDAIDEAPRPAFALQARVVAS